MLLCVAECVAHEEVAVARSSIQFLVRLGSSTAGLAAVYSPAMLQALAAVSQTNDTNRFRVYEVGKLLFLFLLFFVYKIYWSLNIFMSHQYCLMVPRLDPALLYLGGLTLRSGQRIGIYVAVKPALGEH